MNKRLYVGNLSYSTTEDELHKLFSEVGPVASVSLVIDRATGQSKGFAFVEMETTEAAETAVQRLNDHEVDQRNLTVSEARPRREQTYGGGGGRRY
ncbi:MAG: RNA-binding protein [Chloroflexi bacterium HGW-Chloroflexi-1]|nr:MAG: RNA-binding protein [Chloroflexi bacterium HGW-Chloroflexi-1]